MVFLAQRMIPWCGTALAVAAMVYGVAAWLAVLCRVRPVAATQGKPPAVTVLKPLCGAESDTYECLRTFCVQDYPCFQVVFGVKDADDAAVALVRRLQQEFPNLDLRLTIDATQHGSNRKVSNLINMLPFASHGFLVVADSDIRVGSDYLSKVVAPLLDPGVGVVTCSYVGYARQGFWSLLGTLFINEWFMPSVRVAALSGSRAFAFGATIAIRRDILGAVGGFASIADQLADDYRLGERTRRIGLRTVLSEVQVETCVDERSFGDLVRREARWLRTIRAVRPIGYALSFVTFSVPVALLACLLTGGSRATVGMLGVTAVARILMHFAVRRGGAAPWLLFALPLRDALNCTLWLSAFVFRRVHWRGARYRVQADGSARPVLQAALP